jgi:hypothetical protein
MHTSGLVIESAGKRHVQPHMTDGGYVVASQHARPWRKQLGIIAAYASFYNPLRLAGVLLRRGNELRYKDAVLLVLGMWGLAYTVRRTLGWMLRLRFQRLTRATEAPANALPMRNPAGGPASHALVNVPTSDAPGTPDTGVTAPDAGVEDTPQGEARRPTAHEHSDGILPA